MGATSLLRPLPTCSANAGRWRQRNPRGERPAPTTRADDARPRPAQPTCAGPPPRRRTCSRRRLSMGATSLLRPLPTCSANAERWRQTRRAAGGGAAARLRGKGHPCDPHCAWAPLPCFGPYIPVAPMQKGGAKRPTAGPGGGGGPPARRRAPASARLPADGKRLALLVARRRLQADARAFAELGDRRRARVRERGPHAGRDHVEQVLEPWAQRVEIDLR